MFGPFHIELYEWVSRLTKHKTCFNNDEPKEWNPKLIQRVKIIDNRISRAVDFWIDNILGEFMTDFIIDLIVSYNKVEQRLFKG